MKIQEAQKDNLKEISEIFMKETSKKPYNQKWTKRTALKKIKEFFCREKIYVVKINENVAGFAVIVADFKRKKALVDELWLKKEFQGIGIGKEFMKFIENKYKKQGIKYFRLVSNKKTKAFYFYKKLEYKENKELVFMYKKL